MRLPKEGKKYFFFDIDGTLTDNSTGNIVPSAKKALDALKENGHFVAIASGRMHYKTKAFSDKIGIDDLVCAGGACLVLKGEVIQMNPLPKELIVPFLKKLDEKEVGYVLTLNDSDEVYMKDMRFFEQAGRRNELTTYRYHPELDYENTPILKAYVACSKEEEDELVEDIPHLRLDPNYIVIQYDQKKQGIEMMMHYLHANVEDVVVFGDDYNDLVMFDSRWYSIAMGNAVEELKNQADYVTDQNVDDGIWKACRKFGWIK